MMKTLMILLLFTLTALNIKAEPNPGLLEDLFGSIHNGYNQFEASARQDLARLKPLAERMEEQMRPALDGLEQNLRKAMGSLAGNPFFGFTSIDSKSGEGVVSQDHHQNRDETNLDRVRPMSNGMSMDQLFSQAMDPFRIFRLKRKNWWEGDNVCADREVIEEDPEEEEGNKSSVISARKNGYGFVHHMDMTMTSCRDGDNYHECTTKVITNGQKKTVVTMHKCCYGYERVPGQLGCVKAIMKPVYETVGDLGGKEFMELMEMSNLKSLMSENVTLFVPSDEAIEDFRHDLETMMEFEANEGEVEYKIAPKRRRKRSKVTVVESPSLEEILKGHVVKGVLDSSEMRDEDVIDTASDESKLRITVYNTYPKKMVMANCAKLDSADHYSTNGVVHMIDRVIQPAIDTIGDIIEADPQLRSIAEVLRRSGMMERLKKPGQFTFFAPNEQAFEDLSESLRLKIESGNGCSRDILSHHLLPNVICSGVIVQRAKSVNDAKKYVTLFRDEEDELFIDHRRIVARDIVGTNGVLHVIEEVVIPDSARSIDEALEDSGNYMFKELLKQSDLGDDFFSNATLFAPSNRAMKEIPPAIMESMIRDPKMLDEFIKYHTSYPKTCKCDLEDRKLLSSGIQGKKLMVNVKSQVAIGNLNFQPPATMVQCAKLVRLEDEACGSFIHTVDKILLPPGGKIVEIIKDHGEFTKFLDLIAFAELENELSTEGPFTVLAPLDEAFDHLPEETLKELFSDKDKAVRTVQHHVIRSNVCCGGIFPRIPFFNDFYSETMNGKISLHRSTGGHIYADRAEVITCDMMAENGVVHAVDRVLFDNYNGSDNNNNNNGEGVAERSDSPFIIFNLFK